jgi:hypothetical protein
MTSEATPSSGAHVKPAQLRLASHSVAVPALCEHEVLVATGPDGPAAWGVSFCREDL